LRRRADCRYSPVHRAATDTSLGPKDAFGVHAILPRPEGRGLPRSSIIILWLLYNSLLAVGNLVPHRSRQSGHIGIATQQDLAP
jgi:hypothetical protein